MRNKIEYSHFIIIDRIIDFIIEKNLKKGKILAQCSWRGDCCVCDVRKVEYRNVFNLYLFTTKNYYYRKTILR